MLQRCFTLGFIALCVAWFACPGGADAMNIADVVTIPQYPTYTQPILRPPEPVSLGVGITSAITSEWTEAWIGRWRARDVSDHANGLYAPDNSWLTPDYVKQWTQGLDPSLWPELAKARSQGDALQLKMDLQEVQNARRDLASMGWTGKSLMLAANILDPLPLALASFGCILAAPWIFAQRVAPLMRAARAGFIAGGIVAVLQFCRAGLDANWGGTNLIVSTVGTFALAAIVARFLVPGGGIWRRGGAGGRDSVVLGGRAVDMQAGFRRAAWVAAGLAVGGTSIWLMSLSHWAISETRPWAISVVIVLLAYGIVRGAGWTWQAFKGDDKHASEEATPPSESSD